MEHRKISRTTVKAAAVENQWKLEDIVMILVSVLKEITPNLQTLHIQSEKKKEIDVLYKVKQFINGNVKG